MVIVVNAATKEVNSMSHLHIPDGVIDPIWLILGYILTGLVIFICINNIRKRNEEGKMALLGVMGAVMLLTMSIPLGFIPFHINLTAFSGIILGPNFGFLAVFIVNLILAFLGHGGITVVGLNTLIVGSEALFGWLFYNFLKRFLKRRTSAGVSALIAVIISGFLMICVVSITNLEPEIVFHLHGAHTLSDTVHNHSIPIYKLAVIIAPIILLGGAIEALATSFIVSYVRKVKPDISQ